MVNNIPCYDYRNKVITNFTQWDVNQTITIKNLDVDNAPIFHFYNKNCTESIGVQSVLTDGNITVDVPNVLLESDLIINIFVYLITKASGKSIYEFKIPVNSKKKPADYLYIDNIKELITSGYTLDSIKQELNKSITNAENKLAELNIENNKSQALLNELSDKNFISLTASIISGYLGYEGYNDIFGLQVDYENKTFTRLAEAAEKNAGSDFDQFSIYNKIKRCNISDNGTVNAYYGDSTYKDDGTNGQVMVCIPKFYYKVVPLKLEKIKAPGFGYHIRKANYYITDTIKPGFKVHPAFINEDGKEVDYFFYSAYEGSLYISDTKKYYNDAEYKTYTITSNDKLSSVSGVKPITGQATSANNGNGVNLYRSTAETCANHRGDGWHDQTIKSLSALQFLMMIEFGTMNIQAALGMGVCNIGKDYTVNFSAISGSTKELGNNSGSATSTAYKYYNKDTEQAIEENQTSSGRVSISYRGIENPYGNTFKWIQGINFWGNGNMAGGQAYICDDFKFADNKNDDNYSPVGFTIMNTEVDSAYISAFGYGNEKYDWTFFVSEMNGTSALPVGDKGYGTVNLNSFGSMNAGGAWNSINAAGIFSQSSNIASNYRNCHLGCRLIYLPKN